MKKSVFILRSKTDDGLIYPADKNNYSLFSKQQSDAIIFWSEKEAKLFSKNFCGYSDTPEILEYNYSYSKIIKPKHD